MANVLRKTTLFTALIIAYLALAVISAGVFIIEEHDHEHDHAGVGGTCRICLEIQIAQRLIEAAGRLGVSMAVIGFISCAGFLIKPQLLSYSRKPIELKVRFNC